MGQELTMGNIPPGGSAWGGGQREEPCGGGAGCLPGGEWRGGFCGWSAESGAQGGWVAVQAQAVQGLECHFKDQSLA